MGTVITVHVPELHSTPRGAELIGRLVDVIVAWRRVRAEQRRLRRLSEDRESVFRMARSLQNTDPGLASDLYAAGTRDPR
jgi:hypothetical protein